MNRTRTRLAILTLPLLAFGVGIGCLGESDHSYFDDLLDASSDGTAMQHPEAASGVDAPTAGDGDVVTDDGGDAADVAVVGGDSGVVTDSATDAAPDALLVEAGCGPTNTVANCGACGTSCDTTHSTPSACAAGSCTYAACAAGFGDCTKTAPNLDGCETPLNTPTNCTGCGVACDTTNSVGAGCTGSACTYVSCKPGFSMCNTTAPNLAGCACNTPACCGTACQSAHSNGLGQKFYDCVAVGTVDASAQAFKACAASKDGSAACSGGWTCSGSSEPYICDAPSLAQAAQCARCWSYLGADKGTVQDCSCPGTVIGNWN